MVQLSSVLDPFKAGKVWQLVEAASFIGAGAVFLGNRTVCDHVSVAAKVFFAGKSAYFIAQGLCHMAGQSTKTRRLVGWIAGMAAATFVQDKTAKIWTRFCGTMHPTPGELTPLSQKENLTLLVKGTLLGLGIRELSLRAIVWICSKSLAKV